MPSTDPSAGTILIAEDDADDRALLQDAFAEADLDANLIFVDNGDALLRYLHHAPEYEARAQFPDPDLILLDLNMPVMNGREALAEIKRDETLRHIPSVVLTTSRYEEDVALSYAEGANSYIVKPTRYRELVAIAKTIGHYWFETAELPNR